MDILLENPLLQKSFEFAELSLAGKKRYSKESFVEHSLKVAQILAQYKINDPHTLSAAILHHATSQGAATYDEVKQEFGEDISSMLKTIDSLSVIKLPDVTEEQYLESIRKMFLTLAKDLRVVLIKLADILDNLRTLEYIREEKQKEVAKETLEIFAPLVERLGMSEMKGEMQDTAFEFLYPDDFKKVTKLLYANREELNKRLLKIKGELTLALEEEDVKVEIESRAKRLYSLYTKLKRDEVGFDINRVYDLIAFRIITKSTEDCYKVLGIIHKLWPPMPDYVRDYIANPKTNGYQSIHTTLFGPSGKPFEVQIRTGQMHQQAEFGVAAHWNYAEAKSRGISDEKLTTGISTDVSKLDWVKQLSNWQEEITDNEEFLKSVKTDFFGNRIYVFTPKGDVKDLPEGSTPVDFAYSIHSTMGNLATGAKINGKMSALDTKLKNTDVVEVIISKDLNKKPNRTWLNFVATATARRRIKKVFSSP